MRKSIKILSGIVLLFLTVFVLMSIFWVADLRTADIKNNTQGEVQIQFANDLLATAIKKQGLDSIHRFSTYKLIGTDDWKGTMGEMGNPWGWNKDKTAFRFSVNDFDGQVEVLEGAQKGFVAGIQSWDYYEKKGDRYESKVEDDGGKIFTLAAYHYFIELGNRLANAPFIRYAGKGELEGKEMEKVFVSWSNDNTKDTDHYLLWIGKKSGLIEATTFTTRDNPQPAPAFLYGSVRFGDFRNIDGILIPFKQTAQVMTPKDDINDYIHQLTIQEFEWDNFAVSEIRPFSGLAPIGDNKQRD
ncbi:MAG: hypothetical protein ACRBG0_20795 [Lewinella sp.]|uniref:hypothetical protein n=1 Tax=Lewinella sp. TaxID=2004506 RepID=UPI003D6AE04E